MVFKFIESKEILPVIMFLILKSEMVSRYYTLKGKLFKVQDVLFLIRYSKRINYI